MGNFCPYFLFTNFLFRWTDNVTEKHGCWIENDFYFLFSDGHENGMVIDNGRVGVQTKNNSYKSVCKIGKIS